MATSVSAEAIAPNEAIGRSALRKATLHLIPLIALGYGTAYIDRVNISFASLQMNRDLHFSATVYGFGAGLFFLSYAACEIPSNLLLYRFGARRWLSRIMVTWGIIAIAMLFVQTPWQFYTARFFLGVAEAGFFPGVIFYLTQWFPQELRARTISRFYISLPLSSVLIGLVAGPLLNLDGHLGLRGWQWLFLVEGIPAILLGVVFLLILPDGPQQAKWLTEDERAWIIHHVLNDPSLVGENSHALGAALLDPRVWQVGIFMMLMLGSSYAYTYVAPRHHPARNAPEHGKSRLHSRCTRSSRRSLHAAQRHLLRSCATPLPRQQLPTLHARHPMGLSHLRRLLRLQSLGKSNQRRRLHRHDHHRLQRHAGTPLVSPRKLLSRAISRCRHRDHEHDRHDRRLSSAPTSSASQKTSLATINADSSS